MNLEDFYEERMKDLPHRLDLWRMPLALKPGLWKRTFKQKAKP